MQLSDTTMAIIKNFAGINQNLKFKEGNVLSTINVTGNILAFAEIEENIPKTFSIYDVNQFYSVLSLFNNFDIQCQDSFLEISDNGKNIKYFYTDDSLISSPPDKELKLPEVYSEFELSADKLKETISAANILGLPEVCLECDGKKMRFVAKSSANNSSNSFSVELGDSDKKCSIYFRSENLKMFEDDYKVSVTDQNITKFEGSIVTYFIASEQNSTFGE